MSKQNSIWTELKRGIKEIRFSLKLSGPLEATAVLLWNKSSTAEITDLSMTIGDTTFNFDRAGLESIATDTGTALTYALDSPDAANGIVRDDTLTYTFGGFDPDDQFGFRFEIDPDSFDAIVDYRTVLFNNGAAPNSVISVSFMSPGPFVGLVRHRTDRPSRHRPQAALASFTHKPSLS